MAHDFAKQRSSSTVARRNAQAQNLQQRPLLQKAIGLGFFLAFFQVYLLL